MPISYVYVIAFDREGRFLMVRHARRAWEMPGGKLEPGEDPEAGAVREFREETGYDVHSLAIIKREVEGFVYAGQVGEKLAIQPNLDEIAGVHFFYDLPSELSFPLVEYQEMLADARRLRKPG